MAARGNGMGATTFSARRILQVLLCASLGFGWILSAPASGDDPVVVPQKIGTLSRFPADVARRYRITDFKTYAASSAPQGTLIANPQRDVIYQIWTFGDGPYVGKSIIVERAMADLSLKRGLILPRVVLGANTPYGSEFANTLDTRNQRLFLEYSGGGLLQAAPAGLIVIDLKEFRAATKDFPTGVIRVAERAQAVFGLEYDEGGDQLIALLAGIDNNPSSSGNAVSLVGWRNADITAAGALPGAPSMLGPRYVRNCRRDPINQVTSPRLTPILIAKGPDLDSTAEPPPEKTWVTFPCFSTSYSYNSVLIRISREGLFDQSAREEKAIPAPAAIANWAMDTTRGRMFLLNATQEIDAWVYEVESNAFIGIIEMSPKGDISAASVGLGVDERTGRLYGFGFGFGIMITEADQDPVPQADVYSAGAPRLSGQAVIAVDTKRDRIILLRGSIAASSALDDHEIWRVPPPAPPQEDQDPDLLTTQVAEAPGKTAAEFGGLASAYAARILLAGGIAGAVPSNGNLEVGNLYDNLNSRCAFHDREIGLGVIPETELSESIIDAQAESIRLDDNSVKDFGTPSRCELTYTYAGPAGVNALYPQALRNLFFASMFGRLEEVRASTGVDQQLDALGVSNALREAGIIDNRHTLEQMFNDRVSPHSTWTYEPATCAARHYPNDKPGQNSEHFVGDTSVSCRTPNMVSAEAEGHMTGVFGEEGRGIAIKIGRATSFTKVYLDKKLGLVTEATARMENVQIGPITIGFVENTARAIAHGRSGTAETGDYEPKVGLVRGGGITGCEAKCDIDDLIPQINNALGGRAEVRRTKPDARLKKGSPGGYEAGIIKSDKQAASDNALTGDDSREVPALELIIYNDNPALGSARQLVQFAGVRATSNYAIKLISEGFPCPPEECNPTPPSPPVVVEGEPQIIEKEVPGPTIIRRVPTTVAVPGGYRLLLANPRAAGALATVWLLLLSPAIVWLRRRRLNTLG